MSVRVPGGYNPAAVAITGGTGVRIKLAEWGIPFINLSTGNIGNNGALTAVTALPTTFSNGSYIWLPAGAIAAGVPAAAAWYWCVFSSTTAGTIFNSTYTTGVPVVGTTTAFATTGPGAFTGDITEAFGPTITLPANTLGLQGWVETDTSWTYTNNADTKTCRIRYSGNGGTAILSHAGGAQSGADTQGKIFNMGVTGMQFSVVKGVTSVGGAIYSGPNYTTVDSTVASTLVHSTQKGTATDNIIINGGLIEFVA